MKKILIVSTFFIIFLNAANKEVLIKKNNSNDLSNVIEKEIDGILKKT